MWNSRRKTISFYPEPHLKENEVKYSNLNLKKIPNHVDPEKYDVLIYCPVCGDLMDFYVGVHLDWEVLDTPGSITVIPLDQLKPWILASSEDKEAGHG